MTSLDVLETAWSWKILNRSFFRNRKSLNKFTSWIQHVMEPFFCWYKAQGLHGNSKHVSEGKGISWLMMRKKGLKTRRMKNVHVKFRFDCDLNVDSFWWLRMKRFNARTRNKFNYSYSPSNRRLLLHLPHLHAMNLIIHHADFQKTMSSEDTKQINQRKEKNSMHRRNGR